MKQQNKAIILKQERVFVLLFRIFFSRLKNPCQEKYKTIKYVYVVKERANIWNKFKKMNILISEKEN